MVSDVDIFFFPFAMIAAVVGVGAVCLGGGKRTSKVVKTLLEESSDEEEMDIVLVSQKQKSDCKKRRCKKRRVKRVESRCDDEIAMLSQQSSGNMQ